LQQTVVGAVILDISRKYVGGIYGAVNMVGSFGGFLFSVSFGYFVSWFGSYDLALIPVAFMLAIAALMWFRVDATEELIPERAAVSLPEAAVPALS
jgi:nitrate/nitrite transporter NarK